MFFTLQKQGCGLWRKKKKVKPIFCFPQAIQILWKTLISWITVKFFTKCFLKTQFPSGKTKFNNSLVVQLMEHNPEKTDWLPSNARLNQNSLLADKRTAWVSLTGTNPAAQVAGTLLPRCLTGLCCTGCVPVCSSVTQSHWALVSRDFIGSCLARLS